jgi:Resolvase, N terminal domain
MLNGCVYNADDDRPKAIRIFCCHGSQVSEGANENNFCQTTEADCPECCQGTMGQTEAEGMNTMREKRAAIYVRVSTTDQDTGLQETELRQYVESRGWECVIYQDKAQSGAKNDRPALNAMLSDMRRRKFDVVVVWKLDRLARSLKQLLTIGEECRSLGVDLVSLRQNIDATLPAGRLTFQILGAVAEFERELLRERVKAGATCL